MIEDYAARATLTKESGPGARGDAHREIGRQGSTLHTLQPVGELGSAPPVPMALVRVWR